MSASHDADNDSLVPQIRDPEALAALVKVEAERSERERREQRKQRDRRHEERTEASERNREAMEAQRKADTDHARRRVEEARARTAEAVPPDDKTVKRQRKTTAAEPAGPTFATATTLNELTLAAVPDGARSTPPPWRKLIRWWREQDDLNKTLTTAMREALCEVLGEQALLLPWTEAGRKVAEDLHRSDGDPWARRPRMHSVCSWRSCLT